MGPARKSSSLPTASRHRQQRRSQAASRNARQTTPVLSEWSRRPSRPTGHRETRTGRHLPEKLASVDRHGIEMVSVDRPSGGLIPIISVIGVIGVIIDERGLPSATPSRYPRGRRLQQRPSHPSCPPNHSGGNGSARRLEQVRQTNRTQRVIVRARVACLPANATEANLPLSFRARLDPARIASEGIKSQFPTT